METWGRGLLGRENHCSKVMPWVTPLGLQSQPLGPAEPPFMSLPQSRERKIELRAHIQHGVSPAVPRMVLSPWEV